MLLDFHLYILLSIAAPLTILLIINVIIDIQRIFILPSAFYVIIKVLITHSFMFWKWTLGNFFSLFQHEPTPQEWLEQTEQRRDAYERKKDKVVKQFLELRNQNKKRFIGLGRRDGHLFRNPFTKISKSSRLTALEELDQVISIDIENKIVEVESSCRQDTLCERTGLYNLLPGLMAELRSLTVGGAIAGVVLESSCWKYGLYFQTCIEMDILTADGNVVTCSPTKNKDLFFSIGNSYGTFGYILRAKLVCMKTKPFVRLVRYHLDHPMTVFTNMDGIIRYSPIPEQTENDETFCNPSEPIDFLEGVIFSTKSGVIIKADFIDKLPEGAKLSNYRHNGEVFYQTLMDRTVDYITCMDYCWRWDTDHFWATRDTPLEWPIIRKIFGRWLLRSDRMKTLHSCKKEFNLKVIHPLKVFFKCSKSDNNLPQYEQVIQDIGFPRRNCEPWLQYYQQNFSTYPLWICPVRPCNTQKYANDFKWMQMAYPTDHHYDIAMFELKGKSFHPDNPGHWNRIVEDQTIKLGGMKGLYATNFFRDEKQFWTEYDKGNQYFKMKKKYDPENAFPTLYQKVCNTGQMNYE